MSLTFNTPTDLPHRSPASCLVIGQTVHWYVYPHLCPPPPPPSPPRLNGGDSKNYPPWVDFFGVGGGQQAGVSRVAWFRIHHGMFCCEERVSNKSPSPHQHLSRPTPLSSHRLEASSSPLTYPSLGQIPCNLSFARVRHTHG